MRYRSVTRFSAVVLILVGLTMIAPGCGKDMASNPVPVPELSDGAETQGLLPIKVTGLITGLLGGTVTNGPYKVTFLPLSIIGSLLVTVTNPLLPDRRCYLAPEGVNFLRPVKLEISLKGTNLDSPGTTIFWYNPANSTWVDMGGTYSASKHNVTVYLSHFSTYKPGRAGW